MNIEIAQIKAIKPYLPNIDSLIDADDIQEVLLALDDAIIDFGYDRNGDINDIGLKLQKLYDEIYAQND